MKIGKDMIDLEKMIELNEGSQYRIYQTETGAAPGEKITVIGHSVPWKGIRGDAFKTYTSPNGAKPWANLQKAIAVSQATRGVYGMSVLIYPDGTRKLVPAHAAAMAVKQHPGYYRIAGTRPGKKPWIRGVAAAPAAGL